MALFSQIFCLLTKFQSGLFNLPYWMFVFIFSCGFYDFLVTNRISLSLSIRPTNNFTRWCSLFKPRSLLHTRSSTLCKGYLPGFLTFNHNLNLFFSLLVAICAKMYLQFKSKKEANRDKSTTLCKIKAYDTTTCDLICICLFIAK